MGGYRVLAHDRTDDFNPRVVFSFQCPAWRPKEHSQQRIAELLLAGVQADYFTEVV